MKEAKKKNDGVVYGIRHFDFFFFPRFRVSETGIEFLKKRKFVRWTQIKKIRRYDNALWKLTRGPLGSYLYYNDDKRFWISARIIRQGASVSQILAASFTHRTKDYKEVLRTIGEKIKVNHLASQISWLKNKKGYIILT